MNRYTKPENKTIIVQQEYVQLKGSDLHALISDFVKSQGEDIDGDIVFTHSDYGELMADDVQVDIAVKTKKPKI